MVSPWRGTGALELARPLFDALPLLIEAALPRSLDVEDVTVSSEKERVRTTSGDTAAAAEYALWLTMDVLGAVLRSERGGDGAKKGSRVAYDGTSAGEDAERVLGCVFGNPSPQTRRDFGAFRFFWCGASLDPLYTRSLLCVDRRSVEVKPADMARLCCSCRAFFYCGHSIETRL